MPFSSFQIGFTSAPGQGGILAQREFDRRFSPHFVSLAVFSRRSPGTRTPFWFWGLWSQDICVVGSCHIGFLVSDTIRQPSNA